MISVFRLITWLLAVSSTAFAQIFTTTFTWAEGDTVIISQSTDALGNTLAIQTLYVPPFSFCVDERDLMSDMSTITTGRAGAVTPVNPALTTLRTSSTTTRGVVAPTTTPLAPTITTTPRRPTTTQPAVVQYTTSQDTSTSTSWYWYTSNGVEFSTYFEPTFTTISSATPAPSGSIQDYGRWMSSVNAGASSAYANLASGAVSRGDNMATTVTAWMLSLAAVGMGALAIL
ncbi:hypothetical protein QFC20_005699 [Naganishia adeliensis]|uniref:Uncharacterized protein n=1 Tax=Naganishia adeliensis TaxID=92952 RepID=A0ACC2VJN1_9TREE|nr:hypothetical protein QFC20_005699 [Naganishia adeliensis]